MLRTIRKYKSYFDDFYNALSAGEQKKVDYCLRVLMLMGRVNEKFVKHIGDGLFELRIEYNGNIYRVFFIFDNDNVVVLFSGFQKKTQKTPPSELEKARKIKNEYYKEKYG